MKTRGLSYSALIIVLFVLSGGLAWAVDISNTFVGGGVGTGSDINTTTTGTHDVFVGDGAGLNNTSGNANTFVGHHAGFINAGGGSNTFIGGGVGSSNTSGNNNTFVGQHAGLTNGTGNGNTFIGQNAGASNTVGSGNVFLGVGAGYSETKSNMLYIDNCFTGETPPGSGNFCVQPLIVGEFDNRTVTIDGSLSIVTVATPSDIRYKKEIHPLKSSLEKVLQLQGVTFEWDKDKIHGAGYKNGNQIGLIAQEVEKILPELVYTNKEGYKTLSYDKLGPVLIEAIKEQQKTISEQKAAIEALSEKLQQALEIIEKRIVSLETPANQIALK